MGVSLADFTKVLRPLIKKWRAGGTVCVLYLDNGILFAKMFSTLKMICRKIREDLKNAGLFMNEEKTHLYPRQKAEWLGVRIDTCRMIFEIKKLSPY